MTSLSDSLLDKALNQSEPKSLGSEKDPTLIENMPMYEAKIIDSDTRIVGFILPFKTLKDDNTYDSKNYSIMLIANSYSMPDSKVRGQFVIDKTTLKRIRQ